MSTEWMAAYFLADYYRPVQYLSSATFSSDAEMILLVAPGLIQSPPCLRSFLSLCMYASCVIQYVIQSQKSAFW